MSEPLRITSDREIGASQLAGRSDEIDVLFRCYEQACAGRGGLVLISGEAGIGKTSLVRAFLQDAVDDDVTFLSGRCYDLTASSPYGLWSDLLEFHRLRNRDDAPDELLRRLQGQSEPSDQRSLFASVEEFLVSIADEQPLIVLLEDVHWADSASLELLRFLARRLESRPVLILVTHRDDTLHAAHPLFTVLPALARESQPERIELRPLDPEELAMLVETRSGLTVGECHRLVDFLTERSGGNPLFALELLRTIVNEGLVKLEGGISIVGELDNVPVPQLVQQLIESRLRNVSATSRQVLETAAVIGFQVSLDFLQRVSDVRGEGLKGTIDQAIEMHLIEPAVTPGAIQFAHQLVRDALYHGTSPIIRSGIHRSVAEHLERSAGSSPNEIAYHYHQANDARAYHWYLRSANHAEALFALQSAGQRLDMAQRLIRNLPDLQLERAWLLFRTARTVRFAEHERAKSMLLEAEQMAIQAGNESLLAACSAELAFVRWIAGPFWPQVINQMEQALERFDSITPELLQIDVEAYRSLFLPAEAFRYHGYESELTIVLESRRAVLSRMYAAVGLLEKARHLRARWESRWTEGPLAGVRVNALGGWIKADLAIGQLDTVRQEHEERLRRSIEINNFVVAGADTLDDLIWRHFVYSADDLSERHELVNQVLHYFEMSDRYGNAALPSPESHLHRVKFHEADWEVALNAADELLGRPQAQPSWHVQAWITRLAIAVHTGDATQVTHYLARLLPDGTDQEPGTTLYFESLIAMRLAVVHALDSGDLDQAGAWIDRHQRWLDWNGSLIGRAEGLALQAQISLQSGELDKAAQLARQAHEVSANPRQPVAMILTNRTLASLFAMQGEDDRALEYATASRAVARQCAMPFEVALSLITEAEILDHLDQHDSATVALERARSIFEPLRAMPALRRIESLETELLPASRRRAFPAGLTAREIDVLQRIANGKGTREIADELFLSPRTVERHLASIYRKIDVSNRTEAAIFAARNGISGLN